MTRRTTLVASIIVMIIAGFASAQNSTKPAAQEGGMTAYLQFGGTANSEGAIYELNSNIGYDFNSHYGLPWEHPSISFGPRPPRERIPRPDWATPTLPSMHGTPTLCSTLRPF
jgi:hypothetical protein